MIFSCLLRIEREIELVFPSELKSSFRQGVISDLSRGVTFGKVSGMSREFVGDDPLADILFIGESQVLFARDVAEHGTALLSDHGAPDGTCDVVVARGNVAD